MKTAKQKCVLALSVLALGLPSVGFSAQVPLATATAKDLLVKVKAQGTLPESDLVKNAQLMFADETGSLYHVSTDKLVQLEKELKNDENISYVERNYIAEKKVLSEKGVIIEDLNMEKDNDFTFDDPGTNKIWSFKSSAQFGVSVLDAYAKFGTPKKQTIVAVVDTGIDYKHEDLKDVVWKNAKEIPGNGIDDDENGYIDDVYGINTLIRDSNGKATVENKDTQGHGTHVSGTIAATQNNKIGMSGIASNVKVIGIRTVPNDGDEKDVDIVEAFLYAAKNGAKIINCSFGKAVNEGGMAVSDSIRHIGEKYGVLVVAAAGNSSEDIDTRLTYPASFQNDNLLVVAATQSFGGLAYFSNYGAKNVDVAAPGMNIYSSMPGNRYASLSGTSMASPTTAGVAAQVKSFYPDLTPVQLKKALMDSVTKVPAFDKKMVTGGRVDLKTALEKLAAKK